MIGWPAAPPAAALLTALTFGSAAGVAGQLGPVVVSGGVTAVGQSTNDDRIRSEAVGSVDVFVAASLGPVLLHVYVEGNSTPRRGGVSTRVARANTDAGTALNRHGRGRLQISEARIALPLAADLRAHAGIVDATGFLDVSRIANDENLFFLGLPFVNNPTIHFPDYALGGALEGAVPGAGPLRVAAFLSSSNGIADNPDVSYGQLLDVTASGKGIFSGATLRWVGGGRRFALGGWVRTDEAPVLDRPDRTERNRGLFSVLGGSLGEHSLSFRAGLANGAVSTTRAFGGFTYLWARPPAALGVGVARSFRSALAASLEDVVQAEAFVRRRLVREAFVTLSVQRVENAGFDGSGTRVAAGLWIAGARLSFVF